METFANNAVGNLNASILIGATSLVLQAGQGALFPATGNFRIVIGTEIIIVGARSGDTLSSLTRGAESTAAAAHNSADVVTHELTAGALSVFTQELAYVEFTANVNVTATTAATANTIVTAGAVTFDGSTPVWVEFFCGLASTVASAGAEFVFELYDGATDLTALGDVKTAAAAVTGAPVSLRRKLTPSAAAHTFSVRGWTTVAGTATAFASAGAAGSMPPGFIRIARA